LAFLAFLPFRAFLALVARLTFVVGFWLFVGAGFDPLAPVADWATVWATVD
jgi:hypothetical protein